MPIPPTTEETVWQGRPSALVDLPFYLLLVAGAVLVTIGLLYIMPAVDFTDDAQRNAHVFQWLIAGAWVGIVALGLLRLVTRRATKYRLTSQRLRVTTGLLSTVTEDLELRRVRDSSVARPFFQRIVGLGDVRIVSADPSTPRITLQAVRDPDGLQHTLRGLVESLIRSHGVREIDVM